MRPHRIPSLAFRAARSLDNPVLGAFLSPRHVDDFLELVDPTWTVRRARARIVSIRRETSSAVTLTLRPGPGFRGFAAGQHVALTVELAGRATTRVFSIASPESSTDLELTIRRSESGTVSRWADTTAKVGDVVSLGQAAGDFVRPDQDVPAYVFVAGGSGVTPIRSLVETLLENGFDRPIGLLLYARLDADAIYLERFRALAASHPNVRLRVCRTRGPASAGELRGRFVPSHLDALGIAIADARIYVCGPETLTQAVLGFASAQGLVARTERFHLPTRVATTPERRITFRTSGRVALGDDASPILERAEAEGLALAHGCRRGVCHRCVCTLARGSVMNLVTGEIESEPGQPIRICINAPLSDVEIDE